MLSEVIRGIGVTSYLQQFTRSGQSPRMFGIAMHYGSGKKQGELFAFAGLWDGWKDANGNWVKTCSILTTVPNAVTSPVHDRCPSSLIPTATIYGSIRDVSVASEMLKPYEARAMQCYPVSTRINHVGNDDPECSAPVELIEVQDRLFSL